MKTKTNKKIIATLLAVFTGIFYGHAQNPTLSWTNHYDSGLNNDYNADVHLGGDLCVRNKSRN